MFLENEFLIPAIPEREPWAPGEYFPAIEHQNTCFAFLQFPIGVSFCLIPDLVALHLRKSRTYPDAARSPLSTATIYVNRGVHRRPPGMDAQEP